MTVNRDHAATLQQSWYNFLAPKYWMMWFVLGLLRLAIVLPRACLFKMGRGLGFLARHILKKRRLITEVNLRLCFPGLNAVEREALLKENFASFGIGIFEMGLGWWASDKRLKKWMSVEGLDNLKQAQARQKGVLLIAGHFTSSMLVLRLLSFCTTFCMMYRPQNHAMFDWLDQRSRSHYIVKGITKYDPRGLLETLKEGHTIVYTPDQDIGAKASIFAPFFGISAATVSATPRFIQHTGASILQLKYGRNPDGKTYTIHFSPLLEHFPSGDLLRDVTRINVLMEDSIRQYPEQYMWQHRRFKTRPEGEASVY